MPVGVIVSVGIDDRAHFVSLFAIPISRELL